MTTLNQRLSFTLAEPKQLLKELCESLAFKNCEYLHLALEECNNTGFDTAWSNAIYCCNDAFEKEDLSILRSLSDIIGKSDLLTQQCQMEQLIIQIDNQIAEARRQCEQKQQIYISVGTLAGFMMSVLLI